MAESSPKPAPTELAKNNREASPAGVATAPRVEVGQVPAAFSPSPKPDRIDVALGTRPFGMTDMVTPVIFDKPDRDTAVAASHGVKKDSTDASATVTESPTAEVTVVDQPTPSNESSAKDKAGWMSKFHLPRLFRTERTAKVGLKGDRDTNGGTEAVAGDAATARVEATTVVDATTLADPTPVSEVSAQADAAPTPPTGESVSPATGEIVIGAKLATQEAQVIEAGGLGRSTHGARKNAEFARQREERRNARTKKYGIDDDTKGLARKTRIVVEGAKRAPKAIKEHREARAKGVEPENSWKVREVAAQYAQISWESMRKSGADKQKARAALVIQLASGGTQTVSDALLADVDAFNKKQKDQKASSGEGVVSRAKSKTTDVVKSALRSASLEIHTIDRQRAATLGDISTLVEGGKYDEAVAKYGEEMMQRYVAHRAGAMEAVTAVAQTVPIEATGAAAAAITEIRAEGDHAAELGRLLAPGIKKKAEALIASENPVSPDAAGSQQARENRMQREMDTIQLAANLQDSEVGQSLLKQNPRLDSFTLASLLIGAQDSLATGVVDATNALEASGKTIQQVTEEMIGGKAVTIRLEGAEAQAVDGIKVQAAAELSQMVQMFEEAKALDNASYASAIEAAMQRKVAQIAKTAGQDTVEYAIKSGLKSVGKKLLTAGGVAGAVALGAGGWVVAPVTVASSMIVGRIAGRRIASHRAEIAAVEEAARARVALERGVELTTGQEAQKIAQITNEADRQAVTAEFVQQRKEAAGDRGARLGMWLAGGLGGVVGIGDHIAVHALASELTAHGGGGTVEPGGVTHLNNAQVVDYSRPVSPADQGGGSGGPEGFAQLFHGGQDALAFLGEKKHAGTDPLHGEAIVVNNANGDKTPIYLGDATYNNKTGALDYGNASPALKKDQLIQYEHFFSQLQVTGLPKGTQVSYEFSTSNGDTVFNMVANGEVVAQGLKLSADGTQLNADVLNGDYSVKSHNGVDVPTIHINPPDFKGLQTEIHTKPQDIDDQATTFTTKDNKREFYFGSATYVKGAQGGLEATVNGSKKVVLTPEELNASITTLDQMEFKGSNGDTIGADKVAFVFNSDKGSWDVIASTGKIATLRVDPGQPGQLGSVAYDNSEGIVNNVKGDLIYYQNPEGKITKTFGVPLNEKQAVAAMVVEKNEILITTNDQTELTVTGVTLNREGDIISSEDPTKILVSADQINKVQTEFLDKFPPGGKFELQYDNNSGKWEVLENKTVVIKDITIDKNGQIDVEGKPAVFVVKGDKIEVQQQGPGPDKGPAEPTPLKQTDIDALLKEKAVTVGDKDHAIEVAGLKDDGHGGYETLDGQPVVDKAQIEASALFLSHVEFHQPGQTQEVHPFFVYNPTTHSVDVIDPKTHHAIIENGEFLVMENGKFVTTNGKFDPKFEWHGGQVKPDFDFKNNKIIFTMQEVTGDNPPKQDVHVSELMTEVTRNALSHVEFKGPGGKPIHPEFTYTDKDGVIVTDPTTKNILMEDIKFHFGEKGDLQILWKGQAIQPSMDPKNGEPLFTIPHEVANDHLTQQHIDLATLSHDVTTATSTDPGHRGPGNPDTNPPADTSPDIPDATGMESSQHFLKQNSFEPDNIEFARGPHEEGLHTVLVDHGHTLRVVQEGGGKVTHMAFEVDGKDGSHHKIYVAVTHKDGKSYVDLPLDSQSDANGKLSVEGHDQIDASTLTSAFVNKSALQDYLKHDLPDGTLKKGDGDIAVAVYPHGQNVFRADSISAADITKHEGKTTVTYRSAFEGSGHMAKRVEVGSTPPPGPGPEGNGQTQITIKGLTQTSQGYVTQENGQTTVVIPSTEVSDFNNVMTGITFQRADSSTFTPVIEYQNGGFTFLDPKDQSQVFTGGQVTFDTNGHPILTYDSGHITDEQYANGKITFTVDGSKPAVPGNYDLDQILDPSATPEKPVDLSATTTIVTVNPKNGHESIFALKGAKLEDDGSLIDAQGAKISGPDMTEYENVLSGITINGADGKALAGVQYVYNGKGGFDVMAPGQKDPLVTLTLVKGSNGYTLKWEGKGAFSSNNSVFTVGTANTKNAFDVPDVSQRPQEPVLDVAPKEVVVTTPDGQKIVLGNVTINQDGKLVGPNGQPVQGIPDSKTLNTVLGKLPSVLPDKTNPYEFDYSKGTWKYGAVGNATTPYYIHSNGAVSKDQKGTSVATLPPPSSSPSSSPSTSSSSAAPVTSESSTGHGPVTGGTPMKSEVVNGNTITLPPGLVHKGHLVYDSQGNSIASYDFFEQDIKTLSTITWPKGVSDGDISFRYDLASNSWIGVYKKHDVFAIGFHGDHTAYPISQEGVANDWDWKDVSTNKKPFQYEFVYKKEAVAGFSVAGELETAGVGATAGAIYGSVIRQPRTPKRDKVEKGEPGYDEYRANRRQRRRERLIGGAKYGAAGGALGALAPLNGAVAAAAKVGATAGGLLGAAGGALRRVDRTLYTTRGARIRAKAEQAVDRGLIGAGLGAGAATAAGAIGFGSVGESAAALAASGVGVDQVRRRDRLARAERTDFATFSAPDPNTMQGDDTVKRSMAELILLNENFVMPGGTPDEPIPQGTSDADVIAAASAQRREAAVRILRRHGVQLVDQNQQANQNPLATDAVIQAATGVYLGTLKVPHRADNRRLDTSIGTITLQRLSDADKGFVRAIWQAENEYLATQFNNQVDVADPNNANGVGLGRRAARRIVGLLREYEAGPIDQNNPEQRLAQQIRDYANLTPDAQGVVGRELLQYLTTGLEQPPAPQPQPQPQAQQAPPNPFGN